MVSRVLLAGATVMASGCASFGHGIGGGDPAHLQALREVPAPIGAADYCRRRPNECSGAPDEAPDAMALFRAILAAHEPAPAIAAPQPEPAALTKQSWRRLAAVNHAVNGAIAQATDEEVYGVKDYWTLPMEEAAWRGDCEDLALEKRAMLIADGWPPAALSIALAMSDRGLHATLVAHTDHGDFLLDNDGDRPLPLERSRFQWLLMQTGPDMRAWRSVRVVPGEPPRAQA